MAYAMGCNLAPLRGCDRRSLDSFASRQAMTQTSAGPGALVPTFPALKPSTRLWAACLETCGKNQKADSSQAEAGSEW